MTTPPNIEQTWLGFMNAGKQSLQQGKLERAVLAYSAATGIMPGRAEGWINLGSALFETRRYEAAATALQKAVVIRPQLMLSHLVLGDALRMLGKWREAVASYQTAASLQRAPLALNKLACALRTQGKPELAESLYREAIQLDAGFTLARVNLATVQIELRQYDKAEQQLDELSRTSLPAVERREVEFAQLAVAEYRRLENAIDELVTNNDTTLLESALRQLPGRIRQPENGLLAGLQRYADSAAELAADIEPVTGTLPEEWPLIEAMFLVPVAHSVDEYRTIRRQLEAGPAPTTALQKVADLQAAILAARDCRQALEDPSRAEVCIRHWHSLACRHAAGIQPGHFKYTQNWVAINPTLKRVEPALASATFQHFISQVYTGLAPGYARAAVVLMAAADLHAFADGNGRVGYTWMNRELEWAGLMPGLLDAGRGLRGELGRTLRAVRRGGGNVAPVFAFITRAQLAARTFCDELAARNGT
ncbi:MAG: tetratricopeptide repeat protein [Halioglobus sp.]